MEDRRIVELYWNRREEAIAETAAKYGTYLHSISYRILVNEQDAEECVSDTYASAWNTMPPHRPSNLSTFLGKITRQLSIDRWRKNRAQKRGGGEIELAFDELDDCSAGLSSVETVIEQREMERVIAEFLDTLSVTQRRVFLRRYWYMESIADIASDHHASISRITSMLHRTRRKLREKLKSEGYL